MKAFLLSRETFTYENQASMDKWDITHEEFEVMDDGQPPLRVTYTAIFHLPDHLHAIEIHEPYLNTVPKVLQPLLDDKDYQEASHKMVTDSIDLQRDYMVTNLVFRYTANAHSEEELERKRVGLYKELMSQIHSYSPLKVLPPVIRERIKSGEIEY